MSGISSAPVPPQASGLPAEFGSSISKDVDSVRGIEAGLDHDAVREFLNVLEQCEGQILMSGIGKKMRKIFLMYLHTTAVSNFRCGVVLYNGTSPPLGMNIYCDSRN